MERRFLQLMDDDRIEIEERDDHASSITGYAARHYDGTSATEFKLFDDLVERIMPGTFDRALSEGDDVRGLFNHDPNQVLGRASAGTLSLKSYTKGLKYTIRPGDTTVARDVVEHIRRGDVSGSSFGFKVTDQSFRTEDGVDIREIKGVELFDVGPVTYPAYTGTTTAVRSDDGVDEVRSAWESWKAERDKPLIAPKLAAVRARAVQVRQCF